MCINIGKLLMDAEGDKKKLKKIARVKERAAFTNSVWHMC